jgi:hypothetical protein
LQLQIVIGKKTGATICNCKLWFGRKQGRPFDFGLRFVIANRNRYL